MNTSSQRLERVGLDLLPPRMTRDDDDAPDVVRRSKRGLART